MKYFHYHDKGFLLRVLSGRRPSENTRPKRGTWVVQEFINNKWEMPCFPEILWKTLKEMEYLGSVDLTKKEEE